jgi:uncharacterized protein
MIPGFEWDEAKAQANLQKHGVSFDEAASVFTEWGAPINHDPSHSTEEDRFIIIGVSETHRLLSVAFTYRHDVTIRIISARSASPHERRIYEETKSRS